MALISVAELTFDPDFVDPVTVVRLLETVTDEGEADLTEERHDILASIQASSGDNLTWTPDAARTSSTYEIITAFPLQVATEATAADTVLWRGMVFTVVSVSHFGNFAGTSGHYEGQMEMKPVRATTGPP